MRSRLSGMALCLAAGPTIAMVEPAAALDLPPEPVAVEIAVPAIALPGVGDLPATTMAGELYLPAGSGPFPVMVYSHGRSGRPEDRAALKNPIPRGHAAYWMSKGFAVVAPIRPGYGVAGAVDRERSGTRIEANGSCGGFPRIPAAAEASAAAVKATVEWARRQSWAVKDRIVLVGTSAGGLASLAAAAKGPAGVVGVVNFSGGAAGFPKERPQASCGEAVLTEVFRRAGREVKVPSLWLYAENDQFWGRQAPQAWHAAFAAGGSRSRLVMTPPLPNEDGHRLMLRGGRMWGMHLDPFVVELGFRVPDRPATGAASPPPSGGAVSSPEPE